MILKGGTHDMKLGQTILDIRKERKMTQEEFAQKPKGFAFLE